MNRSYSWKDVFIRFSSRLTPTVLFMLSSPTEELQAQGHPVVEASATARAAWQDVRTAFNAGDLDGAAAAIETATLAWPTQVAYQRARAMVAARRKDVPTLLATIRLLTSLESGANIADDEAVGAMRDNAEIDSALNDLVEATSPIAASRPWRTVPDSTFYAEGIDAAADGTVYVASIRHRTVVAFDRDGRIRDLGLDRHPRMTAAYGVRTDPDGESIWVTISGGLARTKDFDESERNIAALLKVRASDGSLLGRWDLPQSDVTHVLGDLTVASDGTVYITDSDATVFILKPGSSAFETITHALFRSLQGIALHPNGRFAYVADYSHGIMRVDLDTEDVIRLPDPDGATSLGLDGIAWHEWAIVGIQNGVNPPRVSRFRLDGAGERIIASETIDRNIDIADEPTVGAILGNDFVYVANSQWNKYDDEGNRRGGTELAPTVILRLPLR